MREEKVNILKKNTESLVLEHFGSDFGDLDIYSLLTRPPQFENGHICLPCFAFSKKLGKKPNEIAQEIVEKLSAHKSGLFKSISNMGPYVNFTFSFAHIPFLENINSDKYPSGFTNTRKTMLEYSQPNTHKELHVGHMRNLCLGNALAKIFKFAGIETLEVTYPGDVGTHVAKALWYLSKHDMTPPETRKGAWLGEVYSKAHAQLESERGTDQEESNRLELTSILKELKNESGDYYQKWLETRQWSIDQMKDIYDWANVKFDEWFFESEVDAPSLKLIDEYIEKGLFVEDQGAIGIDLEEDKLGFFLLRKSDGNGLYSTKDLELARKKFEEYQIQDNLYIVDSRQARHFKQVFKTLEKMGFEDAKNCHHLSYAFVELPDGAMSSRKGNIIALQTLLDQMEETITTKYLNKYKGEWPDSEIINTAKVIANGAIKYGMCRIDSQKKIVFDMEEWLKLDGNSGPYLQYSFARANSIIKSFPIKNRPDLNLLNHDLEKKIMVEMSSFLDIIQECVSKKTPHILCNYLYTLCQDFNKYYAAVNVSKSEENLRDARVYLIQSFSNLLKKALSLLGIDAPERM